MKNDPAVKLKIRGSALSGASVYYLTLIYLAALWGMLILAIPLGRIFPMTETFFIIPPILLLVIMFLHIFASFYSVILESEKITLCWFGIPLRTIPVSKFQLFCAFGNERENIMCLSCRSVEEMATLREKKLLRSSLTKGEVPFRKRRGDWQDVFAREYLNGLRKDPFHVFKEKNMIMMEMQPALQYQMRLMYPDLPYRNYTGIKSLYRSRGYEREDQAFSFFDLSAHFVAFWEDGIHISSKNAEVNWIPSDQIKTVVRVDIFKNYEKYYPHHIPLLYITSLSKEELISRMPETVLGMPKHSFADQSEFLAMAAATNQTFRWKLKHKDCCVIFYTENHEKTIRRLYPDAHWNTVSAGWIDDQDALQ